MGLEVDYQTIVSECTGGRFMYNNVCYNNALCYLLLALVGTGIFCSGCHNFLLHHTNKALLRLGMEGHSALGKLLDAHCMVPLS